MRSTSVRPRAEIQNRFNAKTAKPLSVRVASSSISPMWRADEIKMRHRKSNEKEKKCVREFRTHVLIRWKNMAKFISFDEFIIGRGHAVWTVLPCIMCERYDVHDDWLGTRAAAWSLCMPDSYATRNDETIFTSHLSLVVVLPMKIWSWVLFTGADKNRIN